jgi:glycosyltransferase involved in cell wall biosynthesis
MARVVGVAVLKATNFVRYGHCKFRSLMHLCRAVPKGVSFYQGSLLLALRRVIGVFKREGFSGIKRRANVLMGGLANNKGDGGSALYSTNRPLASKFRPKISVIVPNYNHARYLSERLESIYNQTYGNIEVILLDDSSSDESLVVLREYAERYPEKTICRFNESNSGGVFNQWKNGLELATGELVWIAESDDYCSVNLLEGLVGSFQNEAVQLAFGRTEFVSGAACSRVWTSEEYLSDLILNIWTQPFVKSAHSLVRSGWVVKNIVPNVSGAIFRNPGKLALLDDKKWASLRMCGDWVFYLSIIRGGLVAYNPDVINYYRQHPLNTSVNAQTEDFYYKEHEVVALYLARLYKLDRTDFERQEKQLYMHWCTKKGASRHEDFKKLYDIEKIVRESIKRKPNVVMCVYALAAGGGETFPIMLANLLCDRGYAVTLLNCREQLTESGVRAMLSDSIPMLELDRLELAEAVFSDMGVELVHSHHAWVDISLATLLINSRHIRHIITMHGMYEMMPSAQLNQLMPLLTRQIDQFIYTAEKNQTPFTSEFRLAKRFCKIENALPLRKLMPVSRAELDIGREDFVLCLVARAIPDKGWEEAIKAVEWANLHSDRKIHLLLIGEGPEYSRLKPLVVNEVVHFLGFRSNIRDYYASSDMGVLPSRFEGESFPLVLIDCLLAGKPLLASNVGAIQYMLESPEGMAGELFELDESNINVATLGAHIVQLANDDIKYRRLLRSVPFAAAKFNTSEMMDRYEEVYLGKFVDAQANSTLKRIGIINE